MIEEQGRVVAVDEGFAWVATLQQSACQGCSTSTGCGQRVFSQLSDQRADNLKVSNHLQVSVGDLVAVGIAQSTLLKASLLAYLLPLLLMVFCSGLAHLGFAAGDGKTILAGLSGLFSGIFIVKILSSRLACNPAYHPQLLKKIS